MRAPSLRSALLLAAASVALGGCGTYFGTGIGVGYGSPYGYGGYGDPYGYGGYGGYDPYYSGYGYSRYGYNPYGYGYMPSYYGWYDNYYYPGTGRYVYDRRGTRVSWSEQQRRFWESRGAGVTTQTQAQTRTANWSDYRPSATQIERVRSSNPGRYRQPVRTDGDTRVRVRSQEAGERHVSSETRARQVVRSEQIEARAAARAAASAERAERQAARQQARENRREGTPDED